MVRQINNEQHTKVFKGPTGNALITGKLPNSLGYGTILNDSSGMPSIYMAIVDNQPIFKIAKSGFDATTAGSDDLIFNSSQNVFKIVQKYVLTVDPTSNPPGDYGSFTAVQAHGLGSPRAIYGFVDSSLGGRTNLPHIEMVVTGASGSQVMSPGTYKWIEIDNTNITARIETTTLNLATYEFTVYLQQETAV